MNLSSDSGRVEGEISYDLVMDDDMQFVEGSYRIDSGDWKVFIVSKGPVGRFTSTHSTWESGASGIVFQVPAETLLNMASVESLMSQAIECEEWHRVRGPDSMTLR